MKIEMPEGLRMPECAREDARLIFAGEYEVPLPREPETVLDIGGNVGLFSVWATKRWPGARIFAYEPWPENVEDFERNTRHLERVSLRPWAVGDKNETAPMWPGRNRMCCSLAPDGEPGVYVRVEDAAWLPKACFVKIDTEGWEAEILRRLPLGETMAVVLEAHSEKDGVVIRALMEERGFVVLSDAPSVNGCRLLKFVRPDWKADLDREAKRAAEEQAAALREKKVFVALPVYGGYHPHFVMGLLQLSLDPPCRMMVRQHAGDSLVPRARNRLAKEFLESDATHLLFLDTDLIFSAAQIKRLLLHDEPVVAGLYPKKQQELGWVCNLMEGGGEADERGLQKVRYAGTGCLLVKREVLERLIEQHPEIAYEPDAGEPEGLAWDFFRVGVYRERESGGLGPEGGFIKPGRYLSEDWYFCQMVLDAGYDVWMDTRVVLKHCGEAVYPIAEVPWERA